VRVNVAGKTSAIAEKTEGDWLARAGVEKDSQFSLDAYVRATEEDVHQFQIHGNVGIRALKVDGKAQDWPRGKAWWFVPVPLAKGLHALCIEGQGVDHPDLDVRFGGVGTQRLGAARRNVWCDRQPAP
jgi:hypothetical protein